VVVVCGVKNASSRASTLRRFGSFAGWLRGAVLEARA
jgi:hypothetical protein